MDNLTKAKKLIERKKAELRRFDALPISERIRLREQGLDPHENLLTRKRKQARVKAEIRSRISKMPKEAREDISSLGLLDDSEEVIIRRTTGDFKVK